MYIRSLWYVTSHLGFLTGLGLLHQILVKNFKSTKERSPARARELATHLHEDNLITAEFFHTLASNFVQECERLHSHFSGGFVVVFEGPRYEGKKNIDSARQAQLKAAFQAGQF